MHGKLFGISVLRVAGPRFHPLAIWDAGTMGGPRSSNKLTSSRLNPRLEVDL